MSPPPGRGRSARSRWPGRLRVCRSGAQATLGHKCCRFHGTWRQSPSQCARLVQLECWSLLRPILSRRGAHLAVQWRQGAKGACWCPCLAAAAGGSSHTAARGSKAGGSCLSFLSHLTCLPCCTVFRALPPPSRAPSVWRAVARGTQLRHRLGLAPVFCRAPLLTVRPAVPCRAPASGRGFCEQSQHLFAGAPPGCCISFIGSESARRGASAHPFLAPVPELVSSPAGVLSLWIKAGGSGTGRPLRGRCALAGCGVVLPAVAGRSMSKYQHDGRCGARWSI